jgi:hypothetical protein
VRAEPGTLSIFPQTLFDSDNVFRFKAFFVADGNIAIAVLSQPTIKPRQSDLEISGDLFKCQKHSHFSSPRSISWRIASLRVVELAFAHLSIFAVNSLPARTPIIGSRPVAGRPRPRFFGLAAIDFAMITGLS